MSILGIIFIILGIFVIFTNPELRRPRLKFTGLRIRGLAIVVLLNALYSLLMQGNTNVFHIGRESLPIKTIVITI